MSRDQQAATPDFSLFPSTLLFSFSGSQETPIKKEPPRWQLFFHGLFVSNP
jgi:hypothetical protein